MGECKSKSESESALKLAKALMEFNIDAAYRKGLREGRRESSSSELSALLEEMEATSLKLDAMQKRIRDVFGEAE